MMNLKLSTAAIILYVALIAGVAIIIAVIIALKLRQKRDKPVKSKIIPRIICGVSALITIMSSLALIYGYSRYNIAVKHGLTTKNITFEEMQTGIQNSPEEDDLPDDLNGALIIYYKFGCSDCEAVYNDLSSAVANNKNVYWVSTQSEQGKNLLEKYPVNEVPSGVYVRIDSFNGSVPFTAKQLYKTDENGNTVLDEASINRLLYLQQENR